MPLRVAVAVIHGMGHQRKSPTAPSDELTFSADLHAAVAAELSGAGMASVAWREVFWQDILQDRQDEYYERLERQGLVSILREFVMTRLSDAASYHLPTHAHDLVYERVQKRIGRVITELEADVGGEAPLILVAHSLGAHMFSNFVFDVLKLDPKGAHFASFSSLRFFLTFGCNIPVFLMSYPEEDLRPIEPPIAQAHKPGDPPWWLNLYDVHDPLAYPLEELGGRYADIVRSGQLVERVVRSGPPIPGYRLYKSHSGYWTTREVVRPLADRIQALIGP